MKFLRKKQFQSFLTQISSTEQPKQTTKSSLKVILSRTRSATKTFCPALKKAKSTQVITFQYCTEHQYRKMNGYKFSVISATNKSKYLRNLMYKKTEGFPFFRKPLIWRP